MLREITVATRMVIVCNPNNPTSTALPHDAIADFVAQVPRHVAVLLDEAYCEFSTLDDPDASVDLLGRHRNLVLLRTFSKVHGLCGLRVGYALCGDERFVQAVDQVRQPFFCNAAAQAAAIEALRHQDEVTARVERAIVARVEVELGLQDLGIEPAGVAGELLLVRPAARGRRGARGQGGRRRRRPAASAGSSSGRARRWASPGALRVTYGTPRDNDRFLTALGDLLVGAGAPTRASLASAASHGSADPQRQHDGPRGRRAGRLRLRLSRRLAI